MIVFHNFGPQIRVFYFAYMSLCGRATMSEQQTVSETCDFFLDYSPAEDKHIEHEKVVAGEASEKDKSDEKQMMTGHI